MILNQLTLDLLKVDTAEEVIDLLSKAGFWGSPEVWRPIGDDLGNFRTIGNQQGEPFSALAEKVINSIDAVLVGECMRAGVDPKSNQAPKSMREAVARFFEHRDGPLRDSDGRQELWEEDRGINPTDVAKRMMVVATGPRVARRPLPPTISIIDDGEGQIPREFPNTFMSINRQNKTSIHFVQGKWNMGGTGAIPFCSDPHNLQVAVSRRDPRILPSSASDDDRLWGVTVVRKRPRRPEERVPVYEYLAPSGADEDRVGGVIRCDLPSLPIYPSEAPDEAFARHSEHGTVIKLIEYTWETRDASRSSILQGKSLLSQLETCLPMAALPIRLFEGRDFASSSSAFNVSGLVSRLRSNPDNLEPEGAIPGELVVSGQRIPVTAYVFKADKKVGNFMANHGVVLSVNGQKHASFPRTFFGTRAVNKSHIRKSLGVVLDCSKIDDDVRDMLFMGSRDRIRNNALSKKVRSALEEFLKENPVLSEINNRRKEEELKRALADDSPLEDVLRRLLRQSPLLARYFRVGSQVSAPFPGPGSGRGSKGTFRGEKHPTFFRFRGGDVTKSRTAEVGRRVRLEFETDAENAYVSRARYPGYHVIEETSGLILSGYWGTLHDGALTYSFDAIDEDLTGRTLEVEMRFGDETLAEPFKCTARLDIVEQTINGGPGGQGERKVPKVGRGSSGAASKLAIPPIKRSTHLKEPEWTDRTAMTVSLVEDKAEYFTINKDNRFLKDAHKQSKSDPRLLERRFQIGMALISLAYLDHLTKSSGEDDTGDNVIDPADEVEKLTAALAPVLLPMVEALGEIDVDDLAPESEDDV